MGTELFQFDIHKHLNEGEFNVGREVWVRRFKIWYEEQKKTSTKQSSPFNIVVADVRFPHEANAIREMGGQIWKVERSSLENADIHSSELDLETIKPDVLMTNNGSLEDLFLLVDNSLNNNLQLSK